MRILIIDDSSTVRLLIQSFLQDAGYADLLTAESAKAAFEILKINPKEKQPAAKVNIDLILLDVMLPDMDGIEACQIIKAAKHLQDIPVIIVTSLTGVVHLEKAFAAGAMDYVTKPVNNIELLARIRSALRLKQEMDRRKAREQKLLEVTMQLEAAVGKLNILSAQDGLTGICNRRHFDESLLGEWNRGLRSAKPLSLILIDIDYFKAYNDTYGHQAGDECLKAVAQALHGLLKRPADKVCRYGGEEFVAILPETPPKGALLIAEKMRAKTEALNIKHEKSKAGPSLTISLGVAALLPTRDYKPSELLALADKALYQAKNEGRNRVVMLDPDQ